MAEERTGAKERILDTMVQLLTEGKDVNRITTRRIAEMAEVNTALINYYYQSKENLITRAVEVRMESLASKMFERGNTGEAPDIRLKKMVQAISDFSFENYVVAEIAIANELKNGSIYTSQMILPLLKEIFGEKKSEADLRILAMQLMTPLQVMFLNAERYKNFLFVDLFDSKQRNILLDKMVDAIIRQTP